MTNRRTFLRGLAAVPAAGVALSAMPAVAEMSTTVAKPRTVQSTMYVTRNQYESNRLFNALGRPQHTQCYHPASAPCGFGADVIYVLPGWDKGPKMADGTEYDYDAWFNSCIRTRLMPGGEIVFLAHKYDGHKADMIIVDEPYKRLPDSIRARARENLNAWYSSKLDQAVFDSFTGRLT